MLCHVSNRDNMETAGTAVTTVVTVTAVGTTTVVDSLAADGVTGVGAAADLETELATAAVAVSSPVTGVV